MHIGFIMDGNRRWAKAHAMETLLGHTRGGEVMEDTIDRCLAEGIETVSFWALAKKNIEERSEAELSYLFRLLEKKVDDLVPKMIAKSIRFDTVGNLTLLPETCQQKLQYAKNTTKDGTAMTLIIAIGYGGQDEIVRGVKAAIQAGIDPEMLNEKTFLQFLDVGRFPAPDLIVRTGGDIRHSGYFLYQAEYSEYYFTDTLWPDFGEAEFQKALASLKDAKRNFGK